MTWIIYGDKGSGAFAAEAALAEAGADHEFRRISLADNEQRGPEYLAVNPSGKIPALKLPEGGLLTETFAMLLTIAERFPDAQLLPPPASFSRAEAYRWMTFMASEIYPMVEIEDYPARFAPEGPESAALKAKAVERIRERLLILENAVAGPWLLSTGFSLADIYAAMFVRWSATHNWRDEHVPRLCAIMKNLADRPRAGAVWQRYFPPL